MWIILTIVIVANVGVVAIGLIRSWSRPRKKAHYMSGDYEIANSAIKKNSRRNTRVHIY